MLHSWSFKNTVAKNNNKKKLEKNRSVPHIRCLLVKCVNDCNKIIKDNMCKYSWYNFWVKKSSLLPRRSAGEWIYLDLALKIGSCECCMKRNERGEFSCRFLSLFVECHDYCIIFRSTRVRKMNLFKVIFFLSSNKCTHHVKCMTMNLTLRSLA